jgi:hypothetical protein
VAKAGKAGMTERWLGEKRQGGTGKQHATGTRFKGKKINCRTTMADRLPIVYFDLQTSNHLHFDIVRSYYTNCTVF